MSHKICISAGENSGDIHGTNLVKEILNLSSDSFFFGMGGENLRNAGVRVDFNMEEISVVGVLEVIAKLPSIYSFYKKFQNLLKKEKPDLLIVIDFPDFHFKLIKFARKLNIPVIYYITPQVWAWRKGRTKFLKKNVDLCLNILPFEEGYLKNSGINSAYVGHPLLDIKRELKPKEEFLKRINFNQKQKIIAMLPGSRNSEVKSHIKALVETAINLNRKRNDLLFVIPKAKGVDKRVFEIELPSNFYILDNFYYETISYSDIALVASGTASLECALSGIPSIVFYSLNSFTYFIGKKLVKLPFVSLPNIILNREIFKELIQEDFNPSNCIHYIEEKLQNLDKEKKKHIEIKNEITEILGTSGASKRAAQKVIDFLSGIRKLS